jgi:hypothetical protein
MQLDIGVKTQNIQMTLQDRCRRHIQVLKNLGSEACIKKASLYILFTFFLMRHYIMCVKYARSPSYDKTLECRSRLATASDATAIHTIWPVTYVVNRKDYRVAEMKHKEIKDAEVALVIDQGDCCFVYLTNDKMRSDIRVKVINERKLFMEAIKGVKELETLLQVCSQLQ